MTRSTPRQTESQLGGILLKTKGEEKAIWMGLAGEPKSKEGGATVPLKPKMNTREKEEVSSLKPKETEINISEEEEQAGLRKGKNRMGKGNLKRVAREAGKARGVGSSSLEIVVGTKRREDTDTLAKREGRPQKKSCEKEGKNNVVFCENFVEESVVAARQHRREQ